MSHDINKDYIAIVRENVEGLKYQEIDIPQDNFLLTEMEKGIGRKDWTLLQLQDMFSKIYPEEKWNKFVDRVKIVEDECGSIRTNYIDYLYPVTYETAYVIGTYIPDILSKDEYERKLIEYAKRKREEYIEKKLADNKNETISKKQEEEIDLTLKQDIEVYKERLKEIFVRNCRFFTYAYHYKEMVDVIKGILGDRLKMYSTEQIGWENFLYPIDSDITITVQTNFGYGTSSYFFCNVNYKGVDILPYTAVVNYYYVQWHDLIRHTRQYKVQRESWKDVFNFVINLVNNIHDNPHKFIQEWIISEVDAMFKKLRVIMEDPSRIFNLFWNNNTPYLGNYSFVRNICQEDIEEYKVLPEEKVLAFKAEKICGSLNLLSNLRKLEEIDNSVSPYIAELLSMNNRMRPELEKKVSSLTIEIEEYKKKIKDKEEKLVRLQASLWEFNAEINKEYKPKTEEQRKKTRQAFANNNFRYANLLKEIDQEEKEIIELESHMHLRANFKCILTKNLNLIADNLSVA